MSHFTDKEIEYLTSQRLGRIGTVNEKGELTSFLSSIGTTRTSTRLMSAAFGSRRVRNTAMSHSTVKPPSSWMMSRRKERRAASRFVARRKS